MSAVSPPTVKNPAPVPVAVAVVVPVAVAVAVAVPVAVAVAVPVAVAVAVPVPTSVAVPVPASDGRRPSAPGGGRVGVVLLLDDRVLQRADALDLDLDGLAGL
jgi:hypothetical protein